MKYTKYGLAFALLTITVGMLTTLKYGYRKPVEKLMDPSFFETPADLGVAIMKRFYAPLDVESVVFLGLPSNRLWSAAWSKGFIEAMINNNRKPARIFIERRMPAPFIEVAKEVSQRAQIELYEIDTNTESLEELAAPVRDAFKSKVKTVVILPNIYSSHLIEGNPINRLEKELHELKSMGRGQLFSVSVAALVLSADEENTMDPICLGSEKDGSGTAPLGCAALNASRSYYRKRILEKHPEAAKKFIAAMQATSPEDNMLFVRAATD